MDCDFCGEEALEGEWTVKIEKSVDENGEDMEIEVPSFRCLNCLNGNSDE